MTTSDLKQRVKNSNPEVAEMMPSAEEDSFLRRLSTKKAAKGDHGATVEQYFSYWNPLSTTTTKKGTSAAASVAVAAEASSSAENGGEMDATEIKRRQESSDKLTNNYYDLVTDFYEYGWGTSFHFAPMYKDSSFAQCLSRHEDFLALQLGLKPTDLVLDVGCGVGGPLREIAKFSGATVVGLNNNAYQVQRCKVLAERAGLGDICRAVKGNFEEMPFENETFDNAYAIEATCHARDLKNPYGEVFRTLKKGGAFACYEWLVTDAYEGAQGNEAHRQIIWNLEQGNGISKLRSFKECRDALESCGFIIEEFRDLADPTDLRVKLAQKPWHTPLKGSYGLTIDEISRWKMTPIGRFITDTFVYVLETIGLAPAGTCRISKSLNLGAEGLVAAGDMNLFSPMVYFLARKP